MHIFGIVIKRKDLNVRKYQLKRTKAMKTNFKIFSVPLLAAVVCWALIVACGNKNATGGKAQEDSVVAKPEIDTIELVSSLEELYSLVPKRTFIKKCDLSRLGLEEIPALGQYNIKCLDLSHNEIRMFYDCDIFIPPSVEVLILDSCNIGLIRPIDRKNKRKDWFGHSYIEVPLPVHFDKSKFPNLKKLDISYNNVGDLRVPDDVELNDTCRENCQYINNEVRKPVAAGKPAKTIKHVKGWDEFSELPPNTIIEYCDLSNEGLTGLPVMNDYKIKRLDISGNDLCHAPFKLDEILPKTLVELDMDSCNYGRDFIVTNRKLPNLEKLSASYNRIPRLWVASPTLKHISILHNNLKEVRFKHEKVKYLDVSYNWEMSRYIGIPAESIDTLKTDSCSKGRKLEASGFIIRVVGD